ncbi:hypothetical protein NC652_024676 [Populus alba x Populus x berolinensis]|nr:hypothetical protein NC652_024676 [Populus alba x Populus x berolinensis]
MESVWLGLWVEERGIARCDANDHGRNQMRGGAWSLVLLSLCVVSGWEKEMKCLEQEMMVGHLVWLF